MSLSNDLYRRVQSLNEARDKAADEVLRAAVAWRKATTRDDQHATEVELTGAVDAPLELEGA